MTLDREDDDRTALLSHVLALLRLMDKVQDTRALAEKHLDAQSLRLLLKFLAIHEKVLKREVYQLLKSGLPPVDIALPH